MRQAKLEEVFIKHPSASSQTIDQLLEADSYTNVALVIVCHFIFLGVFGNRENFLRPDNHIKRIQDVEAAVCANELLNSAVFFCCAICLYHSYVAVSISYGPCMRQLLPG